MIEDVTFVVLTRNEERRLGQALASLPAAAEIFVLDAESTDETRSLAARFGARVEIRTWTTFADARRYAITRVSTPWLFMLDADEVLGAELVQSLQVITSECVGYRCVRSNRFCGRIMRGGAWANERVLRLAKTDCAHIEAQAAGDLHEQLAVDGRVGTLKGAIEHNSYPTLTSYWEKFSRYTAIEAAGRSVPNLTEIVRTIALASLRALWQLVVKGGYRDGWRGVFVAAAGAWYAISVVLQARALNRAAHGGNAAD